jgi:CheY-like chemotaxis protein
MPNEQQPLSGCRVLIVEDEYFLAADLQAALKSLGANVIALVGDLDEALDLLTNGGFDIAVVDINLRGRLAYSIAERLQQRGIPFVFVTGYSADIIPAQFADVTRWEKPFEPQDLLKDLVHRFHEIDRLRRIHAVHHGL